MPEILTTDLFWDCECDDHYIHPHAVTECAFCDAERDSSPDSILSEVIAAGLMPEDMAY